MMKERMTTMRINSKEMMMMTTMRKKIQEGTDGCWSRLRDFLVMLLEVFFCVLRFYLAMQAILSEFKGLLIPKGQNILIDNFVISSSLALKLYFEEFSIH